ncbi:MAG: hypothetical protein JSR46_02820 [Verrucomicrobia bacterium]|nr:hypothetical protein [Verrucomicrobiota bacterium]
MTNLLVFASIEEASATIDHLRARAASPWLYEYSQGLLAITGIGSFAALATLSALTQQIERIYSFGIAGSLHQHHLPGKLYPVARCSKLLWHPKGAEATKGTGAFHTCPEIILGTEGLSLISSDVPIYDHKKIPPTFDLVDMEGYAVAFFAKMHAKPCKLYKIVSDYCNASSSSLIKEGLKKHAEHIGQFIASL